jgi:hypothetical protein
MQNMVASSLYPVEYGKAPGLAAYGARYIGTELI